MKKVSLQYNKKLGLLIFTWVAMWSMNFIDLGTKIALVGGVLLLVFMLNKDKLIPRSFLFLSFQIIGFGIVYTILMNSYEDYNLLRAYRDVFLPIILYLVGFIWIYRNKNELYQENLMFSKKIITIVAFSLFIYGSANLIMHLITQGDLTFYNRDVYNIWSGRFEAATTQGSRFTLMSALLPPVVFWFSKNNSYSRGIKIIIIACVAFSIVASLMMANRTLLAILIINLMICWILYLKLNMNTSIRIVKTLLLTISVAVMAYIIFSFDIFGIRSFYKASSFYERLQVVEGNFITGNSRITAWKVAFVGLFQYPMGGFQAPISLSAPHNLWLDVAYTAGIFPLVFLITITLTYIMYFIKLINAKHVNNDFKIFLTSLNVSLLLNCMVEPILGGHYILFMVFMLQLGLMHGLVCIKPSKIETCSLD